MPDRCNKSTPVDVHDGELLAHLNSMCAHAHRQLAEQPMGVAYLDQLAASVKDLAHMAGTELDASARAGALVVLHALMIRAVTWDAFGFDEGRTLSDAVQGLGSELLAVLHVLN